MNHPSPEAVRALILSELSESLAAYGRTTEDVPADLDLRSEGIIDSLGFIELLTAIEEHFGIRVDFEGLDAESLTVVGPLCQYIATEAAAVDLDRRVKEC
jgi:acyl carrier protein